MRAEDRSQAARADVAHLKFSLRLAFGAVVAIWFVYFIERTSGVDLGVLGIRPGEASGMLGVLFAPLLHGDFGHLLTNSLPVFLLGGGLLYLYPRSAPYVLALIWLGGGTAVYFFARPSTHIGASGVTYGLMCFLFFAGALRREPPGIALALIVAFLYGSAIWGVFPLEAGVSYESHAAGAIIGTALAIVFRRFDPIALPDAVDAEDDEWREEDVTNYERDGWSSQAGRALEFAGERDRNLQEGSEEERDLELDQEAWRDSDHFADEELYPPEDDDANFSKSGSRR